MESVGLLVQGGYDLCDRCPKDPLLEFDGAGVVVPNIGKALAHGQDAVPLHVSQRLSLPYKGVNGRDYFGNLLQLAVPAPLSLGCHQPIAGINLVVLLEGSLCFPLELLLLPGQKTQVLVLVGAEVVDRLEAGLQPEG